MQDKLTTPLGEVFVDIQDHERIRFETDVDFDGKVRTGGFIINGVTVDVSIMVTVREDGTITIGEGRGYKDKGVPAGTTGVMDAIKAVRRDSKSRWRQTKASEPARKRIAEDVVPALIAATIRLSAERAVIGVKVLRKDAERARSEAESYRRSAVEQDVRAAHAEALADSLQEKRAWVAESITEARAEQVGH